VNAPHRTVTEIKLDLARAQSPTRIAALNDELSWRRRHNHHGRDKVRARLNARTPAELEAARLAHFPEGVQTCKACGRTRPLNQFQTATSRTNTVWPYCRDCDTTASD
jgi:hypothetical protein